MRSSHVGSLPLTYTPQNVRKAVRALHSVGLEVPPYPQLRGFIETFLGPLEEVGALQRRRGLYFSSPRQLLEARLRTFSVAEAEEAVRAISEEGLRFKALRGPVTGPLTLASRVYLSEDPSRGLAATALASPELVKEVFLNLVGGFVEYLRTLGYSIVFIDEPALTLVVGRRLMGGWSEGEILEVLSSAAKRAAPSEVGIHVCGPLNPRLLEVLAAVDGVRYLSLEFASTPSNLRLLNRALLEKYDKVVSPGIVKSSSPRVESREEALAILEKVYEGSGGRVDLVSGDCGFGGLRGSLGDEESEFATSLSKLRVVVEAVVELRARLSHA